MNAVRGGGLTSLILLILGTALLVCPAGVLGETEFGTRSESCAKCHAVPANEVKTAGGKHRAVPCVGCHVGHPPAVKKGDVNCNKCHLKTRKAHFELGGCVRCHKNPHTPLIISLTEIKGSCVTCHPVQVAQLKDSRSRHSTIECSTCHEVHRKAPQCIRCHKGHSVEMAMAYCTKCHRPHMPKPVMYAADTPSQECGGCHRRAYDLLGSSETKHKPLTCAFCHQEKHRMVPSCKSCHGSPHPEGMMARFPTCGECHKIAHDLNNWPAARTGEAPKQTPKTEG